MAFLGKLEDFKNGQRVLVNTEEKYLCLELGTVVSATKKSILVEVDSLCYNQDLEDDGLREFPRGKVMSL